MPAIDLYHWLNNKFFVVGENPTHHFCDATPYARFLNTEGLYLPNDYVRVIGDWVVIALKIRVMILLWLFKST